ncbi:hypothetical protein PFFVO_06139, partial [Plasmodium falciparum Vietnam Oak-Knoll (FVO)]
MAPGGGQVGGDGIDHTSAKNLLDSIGKIVHDQVKSEAEAYKNKLKGDLKKAKGSDETVGTDDPCGLDYTKHFDASGERYPCESLSGKDAKKEERFSDTLGGQCTDSKIKGNKNNCGACAPFRRLHVCVRNLEKMDSTKIKDKNVLLAEVCYAAKYEGTSLKGYHDQHKGTNPDSKICTVLARSFADIGDIVRGRDPFYGNTQESTQREKLEKNLKEIFKEIHNGLDGEAQARYNGDTDNYYKLREDWWTANRHTVWEAITCEAGNDSQYFRPTCGGNEKNSTLAKDKCRCKDEKFTKETDQVPTYFDYVPQFLRWFEEWAEDFCRLRKRKLKDAIQKCRGKDKDGKKLYCDLNRYDCEKTASGKHDFFEEDDCKDCHFSCARFVKWIDNQKLEFLKQKQKYTSEITGVVGGRSRKKRSAHGGSNDNGYESKFYNKLKEKNKYVKVGEFLDLLSKETTCTKNGDIEEEGKIDFKNVKRSSAKNSDDSNKTFYRTTYCEACPWCGAEKVNGQNGKWKAKEENCSPTKEYKSGNMTDIPILTPEEGQSGVLKKYNKFCNSANGEKGATGGGQIKNWQCYYDENEKNSEKNNNCVEGTWDTFTQGKKVKPYNPFFWDWVYHMLHDSLDWRNELGSCIDNAKSGQCENKCNSKCECFERWVEKKKEEWKAIKDHFKKQKDIEQETHCDPGVTLELLFMNDELLKNIKDTHANADDIKHIEALLQETVFDGVAAGGPGGAGSYKCTEGAKGKHNTKIDKFLQEEEQFAETCKQKQDECEKKAKPESPLRSDTGTDADGQEDDEDDEDDDDDEESEEEKKEAPAATEGDGSATTQPPATTTPKDEVKVCETVGDALKLDNLKEACKQKYDGKYYGWKCVPTTSGGESDAKDRKRREADSGNPTSDTGSICVPPRRRRLYVGKLEQWATNMEATQARGSEASSTSGSTTPPDPKVELRDAFIKSAAIETFFLWHKYKEEKKREYIEKQRREGELGLLEENKETAEDPNGPQNQLKDGIIPEEFKRQMFYTLGDYRDICVGVKDNDVIKALKDSGDASGKDTMDKIEAKIKSVFPTSAVTTSTPVTQNSEKKREQWWEQHGKHIWEGMICALTYKENGDGAKPIEGESGIKEDPDLKNALFSGENNALKSDYEYKTVKLEDENSGAKQNQTVSTTSDTPTLNNPKLSDFVEIPPFFRWLHEWGSDFCGKRARMLEKIKEECMDGDTQKYSGDGESCKDILPKNDGTVPNLEGPSCAISCRSYRKWIKKKKTEYEKQNKIYGNQKSDAENKPHKTSDNEFVEKLKQYTSIDLFLQKLGPCSKNDTEEDNKKLFEDTNVTFKHTDYCNPCPLTGVKCENGNCNGGTNGKGCKYNKITAENIQNKTNGNGNIEMLVSDDGTNGFNGDLKDCKDAHIFKGIRKDVWKCVNICGYDVCGLKKDNNGIDDKQIILIRALFKRWLEYFLEDYNKIKHKISHCTNNGNGSSCIRGCKDKCICVEQWINTKRKEWTKIKKLYLKQYKNDYRDDYNVKNFLEQGPFLNDVNKAVKPCGTLGEFEKSCGLNGDESSQKKDGHKDAIECMLNKLQEKTKTCQSKHSVQNPENQCKEPPPEDDYEDENEKKVGHPKICGDVIPKEEVKEEGDCDKAVTPDSDTGGNGENEDSRSEEEEEVSGSGDQDSTPAPAPRPEPPKEQETSPPSPTLSDQPTNSISDILSSTIPFGIAIALTSI